MKNDQDNQNNPSKVNTNHTITRWQVVRDVGPGNARIALLDMTAIGGVLPEHSAVEIVAAHNGSERLNPMSKLTDHTTPAQGGSSPVPLFAFWLAGWTRARELKSPSWQKIFYPEEWGQSFRDHVMLEYGRRCHRHRMAKIRAREANAKITQPTTKESL
jgi:hypothetical protein